MDLEKESKRFLHKKLNKTEREWASPQLHCHKFQNDNSKKTTNDTLRSDGEVIQIVFVVEMMANNSQLTGSTSYIIQSSRKGTIDLVAVSERNHKKPATTRPWYCSLHQTKLQSSNPLHVKYKVYKNIIPCQQIGWQRWIKKVILSALVHIDLLVES